MTRHHRLNAVTAATFLDPRLKMEYFFDNGGIVGENPEMPFNLSMKISSQAGLGQRELH
jgi:hypothetical protein